MENKETVTLDGCYNYLKKKMEQDDILNKNNNLRSTLNYWCTNNSIDVSDINFDGKIKDLKDGIIAKIPDTDPDHDSKVAEIESIVESHSLENFYNKEKKNIEHAIAVANAQIEKFEKAKDEVEEEIRELDLKLSSVEADIENIKNNHGGAEPIDTDSDFETYSKLLEDKKNVESELNTKNDEFKRNLKVSADCAKLIDSIISEFAKQGLVIEKKTLDLSKKNKKDKEDESLDGDKDKDKDKSGDNKNNQNFTQQAPQQWVTSPGAIQPTNAPKNQNPSEDKQTPSNGQSPDDSNVRSEDDLPISTSADKANYLTRIIEKSRKNAKLNGGIVYKFKDESEISRVTDCIETDGVLGKIKKGDLSSILLGNIGDKKEEILKTDMDEIKDAISTFLPDLNDTEIDDLMGKVYGNEADKVNFLDGKIPQDCFKDLETLISNLNTKNKEVLSYVVDKAKFDSLSDPIKKNEIIEMQNKIAIINKCLISPINLKNARQQVERTRLRRLISSNQYDHVLYNLSKKSREGLKPSEKAVINKFNEGLGDGTNNLEDSVRAEALREGKNDPIIHVSDSQTR